ncbi:MAG: 4-(cytidine 5'-diphospho)-2-C-methyl-D-erythritol kinase [Chlorobium sp.]|jgi:4-diphosphocytidyl-2-C-methyl-D-erythritol kinase|uniref:4-(cytidine 5'-diphospho)-2-C-methyl-D-erythritol kinase n=1 Tax=Chlorobium sp. TaxID=1095 RepID=UPI001E0FA53A|nr:4-(cytidine 5'-diphospho)-2-C-methyl-D-erythritol kinase [Chlorobium sp.]MBN1278189.1 4-(cytidine 5'-diphospho)-2-C-methyl-D-erythritol kinase [Chlorobiaceae bacterium]MCF8215636.1 4-(cytidine 5'-diphospho)-2-C-methyl-D-erythritol kinase [Chlorobium sp.]MCF8270691.1 4-(cytidine 5'-diphospho)-2-C-methyl-D-erythritol kinase [Chlorobium sp.]MCF8286845.1 4-(cytidine 5'-diphospho)-2-C-methyl-D-erythritol kinase [Chlorobium sp.]MCF8290579.1 4-(cytidine 5'-diphospho)-2-C-methyl-D-erythritol kinase
MYPLSVKSFAKINLGLLITSKRPDGYHTLETVFAPVDWFDTLEFRDADTLSMRCTDPRLPVDENNLCLKAARILRETAGIGEGVSIILDKRIPFGAGLGGGSSDAATVLRTLNDRWNTGASTEDLHRLAVSLGADVPYFLEMKGLAFARGIGDDLEDLSLTLPFYVVTVFPEEHISTVWAYRNFYPRFARIVPDLKLLTRRLCIEGDRSALDCFENDFEPAVFDHYPLVKTVKQELLDAGSFFASLSGSGSAVFGLFDSRETAEEAAAAMRLRQFRCSLTAPGFSMEP